MDLWFFRVRVCVCQYMPHPYTLPPSPGHCHIFFHLGHIHKCHAWELLAANLSTFAQKQRPSSLSTQNLSSLKARREKKLCLVTNSFSAQLVLLVAFGLLRGLEHERWVRLVRMEFILPHALIYFGFLQKRRNCNLLYSIRLGAWWNRHVSTAFANL